MKTTMWVITCGAASETGSDYVSAYSWCGGVFTDKQKALNAMTEAKTKYIADILEDIEDEETRDQVAGSVQVYGSESQEFYEVDWHSPEYDLPCETYFRLEEVEVQ